MEREPDMQWTPLEAYRRSQHFGDHQTGEHCEHHGNEEGTVEGEIHPCSPRVSGVAERISKPARIKQQMYRGKDSKGDGPPLVRREAAGSRRLQECYGCE